MFVVRVRYKNLLAILFCFQALFAFSFQSVSSDSIRSITVDTVKARQLELRGDKLNFDKPDSALYFFKTALLFADTASITKQRGDLLNKAGYTHYILGEYDLALSYFVDALAIHERIENNNGIARSYNCIGLIYEAQDKFDHAIRELTKAVEYSKKSKNADRLMSAYLNLGIAYDGKGEYDSAIQYSNRALQSGIEHSAHRIIDMAYNRLGVIFFHQKKYNQSIESFYKSLNYTLYQSNWEECFSYLGLAKSYAASGRVDESIEAGLKSFELAQQLDAKWDLMEATEILSKAYAMKEKYEEAYHMHTLFKTYSDSLFNERKEQEISTLELKQNEIEKAKLISENDLNLAKIRQKNILVGSSLAAGALLMVLAFVLNKSNIQRKRLNEELMNKNESIAETSRRIEQQNQELSKLNQTKSQLLSIVGHDMRSPLHNITAILQMINQKELTQSEQDEAFVHLQKTVSTVADTMDNLLAWASGQLNGSNVNPVAINVYDAVESQLHFWRIAAGEKSIALKHEKADVKIIADVNHFKTAIRNVVGNAVKFTNRGGNILIRYQANRNEIGVIIADEGIGIPKDKLASIFNFNSVGVQSVGTANEKGTGLGLMLTHELVKKNNGRIEIQSEVDKGTTFALWFPGSD